jgi:CHAT domain-containing protein
VYGAFGQNQEALDYYIKALLIHRTVGDRAAEAANLNNIGLAYYNLGQGEIAREYFEKALKISQAISNRSLESDVLRNIGAVCSAFGQHQKALENYNKALPMMLAVGNYPGEARTLSSFMLVWESLMKTRLSILFGKLSVNKYQELRANISGLEKKVQISFLKGKKGTYRSLARILIKEGRLSEAQQVLYMLKEAEYFDFIRRDSSAADVLSSRVDFSEFENKWIKEYNNVMENYSKVSSDYHMLKFKKNRSEAEEKRFNELKIKIKEKRKVYEEFMAQMKEAFDRYDKEIKEGKADPEKLAKKASMFQETLKYFDVQEGIRNAALHYLVYEGRIYVIITTPSSQTVKQTEIDEKEFNLLVINYRNMMLNSGRGTVININKKSYKKKKKFEKKIYDIIVKPVDEELKKYGATNLTISLDGVLRYIPLTALWDGENYLLQRYRISIITPSSLKNIKDEPIGNRKILGLGASRGSEEFTPLPNVGREIRSIVRDEEKGYYGLIKGKAFINEDFTKKIMVTQLNTGSYPLVHISSHFKFSPGDETKNKLLLGDGTAMKLSEIRREGKLFDNVKLLVLSACETGVGGNGEEIDGFGELAQQSGAKSVIASLWPVADESTKELMVAFYRNLKEGKVTSKIEALRQAQLELAGLEDLLAKGKNKSTQPDRKKTKYSNPYYWGPFIMMGNWR